MSIPKRSRWLRFGLFSLAVLVTALFLFYAVEDWRGARAWAEAQKAIEAAGVEMDYRNLFPEPVPDEENLAKAPIFEELLASANDPSKPYPLEGFSDILGGMWHRGDWRRNHRLSLVEALKIESERGEGFVPFEISEDEFEMAQNVLEILSPYENIRSQILVASDRPSFVFPINFDVPAIEISLPHVSVLVELKRFLCLRATAAIRAGQPAAAAEDICLSFRLSRLYEQEPLLISLLISQSGVSRTLRILWEGLQAGSWNQQELSRFQVALGKFDFLKGYRLAMNSEMAALVIETTDAFRQDRALFPRLFNDLHVGEQRSWSLRLGAGVIRAIPDGWFDQFKASASNVFLEGFLASVDLDDRRIIPPPEDYETTWAQEAAGSGLWGNFLFLVIPALAPALERTAETQSLVDLSIVAIGLERYRLAKGAYPQALSELEPSFLPNGKLPRDLITGGPLSYETRILSDGTPSFLLYATGWNGKDDGGVVWEETLENGTRRLDRQATAEKGDYVWPTGAMRVESSSE